MHFLSSYPGTVLLVSHEEQLLRDFRCSTIAELRNQELEIYRCVVSLCTREGSRRREGGEGG